MTTYCHVFRFLWQSFHSFFNCFDYHLVPNSPTSIPRVVIVEEEVQQRNKSRLSSHVTTEENQESVVQARANEAHVFQAGCFEDNAKLVEEGKFPKACGEVSKTPAEIRKRVTIVENSDIWRQHNLSGSSPQTPDEIQQEEIVAENKKRSDLQSFHGDFASSPVALVEIQKVESLAESSVKLHAKRPQSVMKSSPYPTPKRITNDMQTPGTIFAKNMKSLTKSNGRQIRSQYVSKVLNPIENLFELDEL